VETARDWQRRREHILANMQLVMGALPSAECRAPLDVQVLRTKELLSSPAPAMLCLLGTDGPRGRTAGLGAEYPAWKIRADCCFASRERLLLMFQHHDVGGTERGQS
jgi:hypothetical protein